MLTLIFFGLVELDISENLLLDWFDIATLVIQLPKLVLLNLSKNQMLSLHGVQDGKQSLQQYLQNHAGYPEVQCQLTKSPLMQKNLAEGLANIQILVLNYCGITWHDVWYQFCCLMYYRLY